MFIGNMQSFYRRNSIHNLSSSPQTSKQEQIKRKNLIKSRKDEKNDDQSSKNVRIRRNSFSMSRDEDRFERDLSARDFAQSKIPVIKIGMYEPETSKKLPNILKEKEKALWSNSTPAVDDNSERLGPNKNNIIEETLQIERRKSGDWGN